MTQAHLRRRSLLAGAAATVTLGGLSGVGRRAARAKGQVTAADHLIVLWMQGGASHIDTFDPKPGTKEGGPFRAIETKTPGLQICEHLPGLAARSDRFAVVRSMTSKEGNHDRARHLGHTGYAPNPTVAHPAFGAWFSHQKGQPGDLPHYVSVAGPAHDAGFLGVQHGPFVLRKPGQRPDHTGYGFGVDRDRFDRRLKALDFVDRQFAAQTGDASVASRDAVYTRSVRMMRSEHLQAFDLGAESASVRQRYGDSDFGRGCLLARRLVETGVPMVEVTLNGWDTHTDNFTRSEKLMGKLDPAMSALLDDLKAHDLHRRTLVLWMGDFGRTPRINGNEGRDHHPRAWSAVLAGGQVRGGQVYGTTDARGAEVVKSPVTVPDLFATVAMQLGLDPAATEYTPAGRPLSLTDHGSQVRALVG